MTATAGAADGTHRVGLRPLSLLEPLQLRPSPPPRGSDVPPDRAERPVISADDQEDSGPFPLLVVLTALPLAVRRLYPLITFWAVLAAALATHDGATWITVLTFAIAAYGAVAHSPHRAPAIGGLVLAAVLAGAAFRNSVPALPSWLGPFVVLMSAGVAAGFIRSCSSDPGGDNSTPAAVGSPNYSAHRRRPCARPSRRSAPGSPANCTMSSPTM